MDSTGVPHILEHTALCGSEKYPVRDPFFKMLCRSLATFMNAFTGLKICRYEKIFISTKHITISKIKKIKERVSFNNPFAIVLLTSHIVPMKYFLICRRRNAFSLLI